MPSNQPDPDARSATDKSRLLQTNNTSDSDNKKLNAEFQKEVQSSDDFLNPVAFDSFEQPISVHQQSRLSKAKHAGAPLKQDSQDFKHLAIQPAAPINPDSDQVRSLQQAQVIKSSKTGNKRLFAILLSAITMLLIVLIVFVYFGIQKAANIVYNLEHAAISQEKAKRPINSVMQKMIDNLQLTPEGIKVLRDVDVVAIYETQRELLEACDQPAVAQETYLNACYNTLSADITYYDQNNNNKFDIKERLIIEGDVMAFLADVDSNEVLAHEFLHAVYTRLSEQETDALNSILLQTYTENQELLKELLEAYDFKMGDDEELLDELHSFIGTHVVQLPAQLTKHYARYFQNRIQIVESLSEQQAPSDLIEPKNLPVEASPEES